MKTNIIGKCYVCFILLIVVSLCIATVMAFFESSEGITSIILTILSVLTIPTLFYLPMVYIKSEGGNDVKFSLRCKIELVVITLFSMILSIVEGYLVKGFFTCTFGEVMLLIMAFNVILIELAEKRYGHFVKYEGKYYFNSIRQFYNFMNSLEKI